MYDGLGRAVNKTIGAVIVVAGVAVVGCVVLGAAIYFDIGCTVG